MFSVRKLSIRHKLPSFFMITSGVALLVASLTFLVYDLLAFRQTMVDNLSVVAEGVGINSTAALTFEVRESGADILAALRVYPNIVSACTLDRKGGVFAFYARSGESGQCRAERPFGPRHAFGPNRLILYQPVVKDGEALGTVFLESDLDALYARMGRYAVIMTWVMLGALAVAFLLSDRLQRHISGPILTLADLETRVWKEHDYSLRAVRETDDELGVLIDGFNEMLSQIQARDDELRRNYLELKQTQDLLAAELSEAAAYVRSLLPPPMTREIRTDWRFIPSTHLGGDAFGYHWLDEDHLAIYLLDVCGHGVRAALLSVSVAHVLRSQSLPDTDFRSPAMVLRNLNDAFYADNRRDHYLTIWYGVYDRTTGDLTYGSAGHPPAILISSGGGDARAPVFLRTAGFVIGGVLGVPFEEARHHIDEAAQLFVFSDGLYEVTQADGTLLGIERFAEILRGAAENRRGLDEVIAGIQDIGGSRTFEDDCSLVEISFPPPSRRLVTAPS